MRSEAEADRKDDRDESIFFGGQQEIYVEVGPENISGSDTIPTMEELNELDETLFGHSLQKDSTAEEPLQWSYISADNHLMRTLKSASNNMIVTFERQVKELEKDLKRAKRVFYG